MDFENGRQKSIRFARRDFPKEQRSHQGAALARCWRDFMRQWDRPYRRLFMGGVTSHFWVVKQAPGLRKGAKVFRPADAEQILEAGGRLRNIRTPRNRDLRDALKQAARYLVVHHPIQYGFVEGRNCAQAASVHANARVVLTMDIESAFEQVTEDDVVDILHRLYDLNLDSARKMAEVSCWHRRLYQGSPIAPAMFNARAYSAAVRLEALARANGLKVTMYADDLCISSDRWTHFSKGFQKTVIRILAEEGLVVNPRKTRITRPSSRNVGSTVITGLTIDYDDVGALVRPAHRGRFAAKAGYLDWLINARGIEWSRELARDGERKRLACVVSGLLNWVQVAARPPAEQLPLYA